MELVERELSAIKQALQAIDADLRVASSWPRDMDALPLALVQLAGENPADYRDGGEYLTRLEWYVRVFAAQKETVLLPLCERVKEAMEALGYARAFRWDEDSAEVSQVVFRFNKTL